MGEPEVLIAVITDSYLRSTICISEISAFWYTGKPIIPLPPMELISRLEQYQIIYIVSIMDTNMIQTLPAQFIPRALIEGKNLCVDSGSKFPFYKGCRRDRNSERYYRT